MSQLFYNLSDFLWSDRVSLPEVGLGELLHVEGVVCERTYMKIALGWEHFTWSERNRDINAHVKVSRSK